MEHAVRELENQERKNFSGLLHPRVCVLNLSSVSVSFPGVSISSFQVYYTQGCVCVCVLNLSSVSVSFHSVSVSFNQTQNGIP